MKNKAIGGIISGMRRRIRSMGLGAELESKILGAIHGENRRNGLARMPKVVYRTICSRISSEGPLVITLGKKQWSVYSMDA